MVYPRISICSESKCSRQIYAVPKSKHMLKKANVIIKTLRTTELIYGQESKYNHQTDGYARISLR